MQATAIEVNPCVQEGLFLIRITLPEGGPGQWTRRFITNGKLLETFVTKFCGWYSFDPEKVVTSDEKIDLHPTTPADAS